MEELLRISDWTMLICAFATGISLLMCTVFLYGERTDAEPGTRGLSWDIRTQSCGLPQNHYRFAMEKHCHRYRIEVLLMPAVSGLPRKTRLCRGRLYLQQTFSNEAQAREAAGAWAEQMQKEIAGAGEDYGSE